MGEYNFLNPVWTTDRKEVKKRDRDWAKVGAKNNISFWNPVVFKTSWCYVAACYLKL